MQTKFPTTILTVKPDFIIRDESERDYRDKTISISIYIEDKDFINLVINDELKTVFKCEKEDNLTYLYVVKEGFCFYTDCYELKNYEEFFNAQKTAEDLGFSCLSEHMNAKKNGIINSKEYFEYVESGFYNEKFDGSYNNTYFGKHIEKLTDEDSESREYKRFLDAKKRGLSSKEDYDLANFLEIDNSKELIKFQKSKFYDSYGLTDYYGQRKIQESYKEFKEFDLKEQKAKELEQKAKELGFNSNMDYKRSKELGFNEAIIYYEFLKSGCKTRQEYEFFKKLPTLIDKIDSKINEIIKDANDAYNTTRFEESIRLKFLVVEKISEKIYLRLFNKELESDKELKIDDIICQFEEKLNEQLVDHEELKYWRRIRNNIVHENAKIEKEKIEKGKEFFEEFFNKLNASFNKINQN